MVFLLLFANAWMARGEAMLELFQVSWSDLTQKMPELAEAGYASLWLPPPAKGTSGSSSVGYDLFDPFDLGDKNQAGTTATKYGTRAQLIQMVQTAHQFGIRVYFDNIMNHRGNVVPGYNSGTATNYYPGMLPQDFHLKTVSGGFYANWADISDWCNVTNILYNPLLGLVDIANEPGSVNGNFGSTLYNTIPKISFVRHPNNPEYYLNTSGPSLGGPWYPFNTTNGTAVADDVNTYLIRAAMWTLNTTKCDGFRLDAVKQVPAGFFGATSSSPQTDDPTFSGYTGGIQAIYDYVHGYGTNVTGNGYMETDGNRNSCFDTEVPRNDALIFGEHVNAPPNFQDYLNGGMRVLNYPLFGYMNSVLAGNASFSGLDGRDFNPPQECCTENGTQYCYPTFSPALSVMFAQNQDTGGCCPVHREMQDAFYFMHEGLPMIYSDNYNWAGTIANSFPIASLANYLGEYANNQMPEIVYLHGQLARGGTRSRWSDQNIVCWERYDYRDVNNVGGAASTNADATVVLFAMNDSSSDILFDDGVSRTADGYYGCWETSTPSRGNGMVVGFPPGSVLTQMASTSTGASRACAKLLVHGATTSRSAATNSANASDPTQRLIYVNTAPPAGGGAVEMLIPSDGWVIYGYQWPEASRANALTNAINFRQGGAPVSTLTVYRHDGPDGDTNFSPVYPFKMRGSVDPNGNVIMAPGEGNVSNLTYAIIIPVVTNGQFDITVRCDASASNAMVKLDGGMDLNSQMGLGPTTGSDLRDNRPGYASDVYLGYEQSAQQFRFGPEMFAARLNARNNVTSLGAETYYYTTGGADTVVNGSGNASGITNQTASWVYHDPVAAVTVLTNASVLVAPATQMVPTNPVPGQAVDIWVKVGYNFPTNYCSIYYTTDGSNPDGSFGVGKGTTQVAPGSFMNSDSADSTIAWFKGTIPGANQSTGVQVRYRVAVYESNIPTIPDSDNSKLYGLTQFGITNFNPTTVQVWLHNDLNPANTSTGLQSGFHIARARCFLPRNNKSAVYNTFAQTFYYDGQLPGGVIVYPSGGNTLTTNPVTVVVRADSTVTAVDFNIQDSDPGNDDSNTGQANGNGNTNGAPVFVSATQVTPTPALNLLYTNYPQQFQFSYANVPTNGTANIIVRLKTLATVANANRLTALTNTVNTLAPPNALYFSSPSADWTGVVVPSNTNYLVQACFTPSLNPSGSTAPFSLFVNNQLQPRANYFIRSSGSVVGCPGLNSFLYLWTPQEGSNFLQLNFTTNGVSLSATRIVPVGIIGSSLDSNQDGMPDWMALIAGLNPYDPNSVFRITGLTNGNQVAWSSVSNIAYQVLATTNLVYPMAPISTVITGAGPTTFWTDISPDPTNKFYRIQVVH